MESIRSLYLANNEIGTVEGKTFYNVPKSMKSLKLDHNEIRTLPANMLNRANHPNHLKLDVTYNPLQCDTNVCWLMKGEEDGWLWGTGISQVVRDCDYVSNHTGHCPEDIPVDESSSSSRLVYSTSLALVIVLPTVICSLA